MTAHHAPNQPPAQHGAGFFVAVRVMVAALCLVVAGLAVAAVNLP